MGDIYIKGVTVRFGFDVLEPGKFELFVKNKATGTPYGVHILHALNFSCDELLWDVVRVFCYIHHRGAFGVARFDKQGNSRALTREASDRLAPRFFVYVRIILIFTSVHRGSQVTF